MGFGDNKWMFNLLKALDDSEVQQKIREIVGGPAEEPTMMIPDNGGELAELRQALTRMEQENAGLEQENSSLAQELSEAKRENQGLMQEVSGAEQKYADCCARYQSEVDAWKTRSAQESARYRELEQAFAESRNELERLKQEALSAQKREQQWRASGEALTAQYHNIDTAYRSFCTLPEPMRAELNTILKSDSPEVFMAYSSQFDNVKALWSWMKSRVDRFTEKERNTLLAAMEFSIRQCNSLFCEPPYALMLVRPGVPFDEARHIRGEGCSPYQGNVRDVLLPGIVSRQNVVCKCVVRY